MRFVDYDFDGKRVFLSGPMTGRPDWNRAAFSEAARKCYARGAVSVFDPAMLAPAEGVEPKPHEHYMLKTLYHLTERKWKGGGWVPQHDCIVMLDGWRESEGARVEEAVARAVGIEVVE